MRKIIIMLLVLAMTICIAGCGKKNNDTASYTIKDFLFSQAVSLAHTLGNATKWEDLKSQGLSGQAIKQAQNFSPAASFSNITKGMLLRIEDVDLPEVIQRANVAFCTEDQMQCIQTLIFTQQFKSTITLQQTTAIYLQYGKNCHMIILFEPGQGNSVQATVYPLFTDAALALLDQFKTSSVSYSKAMIASACDRVDKAS